MASSPTQLELERKIRAYVAIATGMAPESVIPGNDNHPAPNSFYATVLALPKEKMGLDTYRSHRDEGDENIVFDINGNRLAGFSVQFYRSIQAFDAAESLIGFAETPLGNNTLGELGLVWGKNSEVRNLSKVMSDQYEPRAQVDIYFQVSESREQIIPIIKSGNIDIKEDAEGHIITDQVQVI